ncbi:MAG: hypothetical protein RBU37_07780 [Myxococcota bacterium]|jgi:hypothetical protein|nr:hypothetical protein [Myxococcota bacterium]
MRAWFLLPLLALLLSSCGAEEGAESFDDQPLVAVPDGKADDYRSTTGKEYSLMAVDVVRLSVADAALTGAERDARVEELIGMRNKAIAFFVYAYLAGKSSHDSNAEYGDFKTTIRQRTFDNLVVGEREDEPGAYEYLFAAEAAGPNDLLSQLPMENGSFVLKLPRLSNSELESGSYSRTYSSFDAAKYSEDQLENLVIDISPMPAEPDAFPEYARLFEDGLLDVAIHVGGDYNAERWDIVTAKEIFGRLSKDLRLTAPVKTFEELESDSGPFTGTINANGTKVAIEVYLYHPDMQKESGVGYNGLIDLYRQSTATRDIVIYDGHAGYDASYSGIVVHYNPRHAISANDLAELEMPNKYQLFFFNGCKTYTTYADALYANPAKNTANLDIITTVNFAWMSEMSRISSEFLRGLLALEAGKHLPNSYDQVLARLNSGASTNVIYGVHGLSDNPHRSPYAELDNLCTPCRSNSQCSGAGNMCITPVGGAPVCGFACTADDACPEGYACVSVSNTLSNVIIGAQCLPRGGVCPGR